MDKKTALREMIWEELDELGDDYKEQIQAIVYKLQNWPEDDPYWATAFNAVADWIRREMRPGRYGRDILFEMRNVDRQVYRDLFDAVQAAQSTGLASVAPKKPKRPSSYYY